MKETENPIKKNLDLQFSKDQVKMFDKQICVQNTESSKKHKSKLLHHQRKANQNYFESSQTNQDDQDQ